jgi:hypothetical protein
MGCVYIYGIHITTYNIIYIYTRDTYHIYGGDIPSGAIEHPPQKKKPEVDRKNAAKGITAIELPRLITRGSARLGCLDVSISGMGTPSYGHETNRRRPKIEG